MNPDSKLAHVLFNDRRAAGDPPRRLFDFVQVGKAVRVCDNREDALQALGR